MFWRKNKVNKLKVKTNELQGKIEGLEKILECLSSWRKKHLWVEKLEKHYCPTCKHKTIMEDRFVFTYNVSHSVKHYSICYQCGKTYLITNEDVLTEAEPGKGEDIESREN